jgi:prevent-host-death family protein
MGATWRCLPKEQLAPIATCSRSGSIASDAPARQCATMLHMERVGVRELRQQASAILRRVAAGETFEVTDRGRPVARLVRASGTGLAQLEREGLVRRAEADLLELETLPLPRGARPPSELVAEARGE